MVEILGMPIVVRVGAAVAAPVAVGPRHYRGCNNNKNGDSVSVSSKLTQTTKRTRKLGHNGHAMLVRYVAKHLGLYVSVKHSCVHKFRTLAAHARHAIFVSVTPGSAAV